MAVRVFKAIWYLSVLAAMAALLYHYAGLPETVVVGQGDVNFQSVGRDTFFYVSLLVLALINVTVYVVRRQTSQAPGVMTWFYGFISVINFFAIIALSFISLFNSNESFRYGEIGYVIYGSLFLIGAWLVGGLLYAAVHRLQS